LDDSATHWGYVWISKRVGAIRSQRPRQKCSASAPCGGDEERLRVYSALQMTGEMGAGELFGQNKEGLK